MAQNDGQILAFTSSDGSKVAASTTDVLSGLLTPNAGSTFTSYVPTNTQNQSDEGFGFDLVNGLYFKIQLTSGSPQYYVLNSYNLSGTLLHSVDVAQPSNKDDAGSFVVDPTNHLIYVSTFTGTGNANDTQQNEIYKIAYNATTGAFVNATGTTSPLPYDPTQVDSGGNEVATQGVNNSQVLVSSQSDATFNYANDIQLDAMDSKIVYIENSSTYNGPNGTVYPAHNAIFSTSTAANNGTQTQITDSDQVYQNNGKIVSVAVDSLHGLVYFTTIPQGSTDAGAGALYVIPLTARGNTFATQIASPSGVTLPTYAEEPSNAQGLVFDPTSRQLYFYTDTVNDGAATAAILSGG